MRIITTVGTSLFTNYEHQNNDISGYLKILKNKESQEKDKSGVNDYVNPLRENVMNWIMEEEQYERVSAEIESFLNISMETKENNIEIFLLATDTVLSTLATEIIHTYLNSDQFIKKIELDKRYSGKKFNSNYNPQYDVIRDLQMKDKLKFEKSGLANLIHRVTEITYGYENISALNITGGYKALIPHMTIIGQINNLPIYYLFNDEISSSGINNLIRIPQAPIDINWGLFERYSHVLEELNTGIFFEEKYNSWEKYIDINKISKEMQTLIWYDNEMAELNSIGKIFYERYKTFFIIEVPNGGKFFSEEPTKKEQLIQGIKDLYLKLKDLETPLETLHDTNLKHVLIKDTYIFKYTKTQIRIQYKYTEDGILRICNYYFINSGQIDKQYSKLMTEQYETIKNSKFTIIPIKL